MAEPQFDFFTNYIDSEFERPTRKSVLSRYTSILDDLCDGGRFPPALRRELLVRLVNYSQLDYHERSMRNLSSTDLCKAIKNSQHFIKYHPDAQNPFDPLTPPSEIPSVFRLWYHSNGIYRVVNIFDLAAWLATGNRTDPLTRIRFSSADMEKFYIKIVQLVDFLYDVDNSDPTVPAKTVQLVKEQGMLFLRLNSFKLIPLGDILQRVYTQPDEHNSPTIQRLRLYERFGAIKMLNGSSMLIHENYSDWSQMMGYDSLNQITISGTGDIITENKIHDEDSNFYPLIESLESEQHYFIQQINGKIICLPAQVSEHRRILQRVDDLVL